MKLMRNDLDWGLPQVTLRKVFVFILKVNDYNLFCLLNLRHPLAHFNIWDTFVI